MNHPHAFSMAARDALVTSLGTLHATQSAMRNEVRDLLEAFDGAKLAKLDLPEAKALHELAIRMEVLNSSTDDGFTILERLQMDQAMLKRMPTGQLATTVPVFSHLVAVMGIQFAQMGEGALLTSGMALKTLPTHLDDPVQQQALLGLRAQIDMFHTHFDALLAQYTHVTEQLMAQGESPAHGQGR